MSQHITDGMLAALKAPKQFPISKVEILEPLSRAIQRTITEVDEGTVTVDVSRGTRRTMQLRLSNKDGAYTPTSAESDFAFGRLVRVYRGLRFWDEALEQEVEEYLTLGTFMIDRPEIFVERNMSVATIDGSDLWKKIATGGFPTGFSFATGTHINTVIAKVALDSGIEPLYLTLDPLSTRTDSSKKLGNPLGWEQGDNRSDFLLKLADQWGLQIYFTPNGFLTSAEIPNIAFSGPAWTFTAGEDAVMLGVTRIQSDLKLINNLTVRGESTASIPSAATFTIKDEDPSSQSYYLGPMGNRFMLITDPQITTLEQATVAAQKAWAANALIAEEIKLPTLCLPHLEGNDIVQIDEPMWAKVSANYLCLRFDIGLRETKMTITSQKAIEI